MNMVDITINRVMVGMNTSKIMVEGKSNFFKKMVAEFIVNFIHRYGGYSGAQIG